MVRLVDALTRRAALWNRRRLHRRVLGRMPDHDEWCARHDRLDEAALAAIRQRVERLPAKPVVALLLRGEPSRDQMAALAALLRAQLYPHWTLHVAPGTVAEAGQDQRISSAPPTADWVALVHPVDRWCEHTLALLVEAALRFAQAELVYADEDCIDPAGRRHHPRFKPDWNPELLLSIDAIGRPALWRRTRLETTGALAETDDHAFALRATAGLDEHQVVHVPHLLLHRTAPPSHDPAAEVAAVQGHLARHAIDARAEWSDGGVRVRFALPQPPPPVTIVIPTRNGLELLRGCVESIVSKTDYPDYDIVVIDNGSDEPACLAYLASLTKRPRIAVRRDERPFNFAALNNAAVREARGELVALVNNDIEVIGGDWLAEMVSLAVRPGIGAVGARLWYGDGTLQHAGVVLGIGGGAGHGHKRLTRGDPGSMGRARVLQGFSAVTAACLVVRRSSCEAVGGLDEDFAVAFNDIDFCLKLRERGLRNLWTPHAELYHHESVSRGSDRRPEKKERFLRERERFRARWARWIEHDPAYNPNLTLEHETFTAAEAPRVSLLRPWFEGRPE